MCGITGIFHLDPRARIDELLLHRLNAAIAHRGPDDDGFYVNGPVGLANRRLSIIGLADGRQPIANEDGTVWTVYNGEIYNYPELRAALEQKGHRFRTSTDTEVIVHAYEEHGADFVERLNGMFAIALWDDRRRRLLLYRDRLGEKPLYYTVTRGRLVFASELKALLQDPSVGRAISPEALGAFLSGGVDSSTVTALMTGITDRPVQTFAVGFRVPGAYDESAHAERVARHFGADHRTLVVGSMDVEHLLPRTVYHLDEPIADYAAIPTFLLSEFARRHVKVVLTGEGADELFAGYPHYRFASLLRHYERLPRGARRLLGALGGR